MIYADVDLDKWIKKYGLEIETYNCPKCGGKFETTQPVVTKESAGLVTPIHECGEKYWIAILTPRTAESIALWNKII